MILSRILYLKQVNIMIKELFYVGLGGGLGSMLRYVTTFYTNKYVQSSFPLATFLVNIGGCFLVGILLGLSEKYVFLNNELKLLLIIGFCGGYTTFSAFSAESLRLFEAGNYFILCVYIVVTVLLSLFFVWLGNFVIKTV